MEHQNCFFVALPYGERYDWLRNVLAKGNAEITSHGERYPIDQPKLIPISEATLYLRPKEQRLQRRSGVESALQVHRV